MTALAPYDLARLVGDVEAYSVDGASERLSPSAGLVVLVIDIDDEAAVVEAQKPESGHRRFVVPVSALEPLVKVR